MRNVVDEAPTRNLHGRLKFVHEFLPEGDCTRRDILDVGCGFGWFELLALDRNARSVTGVEPSDEDLGTARRYLDDERLTFRPGSAIGLPFENETFDTIVCWEDNDYIRVTLSSAHSTAFARAST